MESHFPVVITCARLQDGKEIPCTLKAWCYNRAERVVLWELRCIVDACGKGSSKVRLHKLVNSWGEAQSEWNTVSEALGLEERLKESRAVLLRRFLGAVLPTASVRQLLEPLADSGNQQLCLQRDGLKTCARVQQCLSHLEPDVAGDEAWRVLLRVLTSCYTFSEDCPALKRSMPVMSQSAATKLDETVPAVGSLDVLEAQNNDPSKHKRRRVDEDVRKEAQKRAAEDNLTAGVFAKTHKIAHDSVAWKWDHQDGGKYLKQCHAQFQHIASTGACLTLSADAKRLGNPAQDLVAGVVTSSMDAVAAWPGPACLSRTFCLRSLKEHERRYRAKVTVDGQVERCAIYNEHTKKTELEFPVDRTADGKPSLVICIDHGSVGWPAVQFSFQHCGLLGFYAHDPRHRCWNDLRAGMVQAPFWPVVREMTESMAELQKFSDFNNPFFLHCMEFPENWHCRLMTLLHFGWQAGWWSSVKDSPLLEAKPEDLALAGLVTRDGEASGENAGGSSSKSVKHSNEQIQDLRKKCRNSLELATIVMANKTTERMFNMVLEDDDDAAARMLDEEDQLAARTVMRAQEAQKALERLNGLWERLMRVEKLAVADTWFVSLKKSLTWAALPSVRAVFIALEEHRWTVPEFLRKHLQGLFYGLLHTKTVEECFNELTDD
eukprot:s1490_g15.t1